MPNGKGVGRESSVPGRKVRKEAPGTPGLRVMWWPGGDNIIHAHEPQKVREIAKDFLDLLEVRRRIVLQVDDVLIAGDVTEIREVWLGRQRGTLRFR
jgi:hypothetical protein